MKIYLLLLIISINTNIIFAQKCSVDSLHAKTEFDNLNYTKLFSDSLASSFFIEIKKDIDEHKHALHSEHIVVIEGSARMTLADSAFHIQKGDIIFIPKNTFHSVSTVSSTPLKVISIQAPYFDGTDRIWK